MPAYTITIISDPVCPWCYIGHNRLTRAISLFTKTHPAGPSSTFSISWSPFYLDPSAPTHSISKRERAAQRHGQARVDEMFARLRTLGEREGIVFSFEGRIGSTRNAHRLIGLAGKQGEESGMQGAVVEGLFKEHFEGDADITDVDWLVSVATEAGMDGEMVRSYLESEEGGEAVDETARRNRGKVNGVPAFEIGEFFVEGAQEEMEFYEVFAKIAEREEGTYKFLGAKQAKKEVSGGNAEVGLC
ncbi:thioredoxin-like protein [Microthyrium microscopicum]|uniref:Thioredoxin-like protein n=1 Tax=Microthyrium microscopicum TaxID=703497 RepID=A0A6A6UI11_9PEZI|nr:thioredoxin-like protein [Microthyrium microscopicum]